MKNFNSYYDPPDDDDWNEPTDEQLLKWKQEAEYDAWEQEQSWSRWMQAGCKCSGTGCCNFMTDSYFWFNALCEYCLEDAMTASYELLYRESMEI